MNRLTVHALMLIFSFCVAEQVTIEGLQSEIGALRRELAAAQAKLRVFATQDGEALVESLIKGVVVDAEEMQETEETNATGLQPKNVSKWLGKAKRRNGVVGGAGSYWSGIPEDMILQNVLSVYKDKGELENCFEARKTSASCKKDCSRHWMQHPQCKAKCSGHCKQDCLIPTRTLNEKCMPTEVSMKTVRENYVKLCGTSGIFGHPLHGQGGVPPCDKEGDPQWFFYTGGSVKCPCAGKDGKLLDKQDALYSILGQLGQIGVPPLVAAQVATGTSRGESWNIMAGYASVLMINCWQKKCLGVETEELLAYGGGTDC